MFSIGDYVVAGKNGICVIEDIGTPEFLEKGKDYYILRSITNPAGRAFIPLQKADDVMRKAMTRDEAEALIADIPRIEIITIANEKMCEEMYKECFRKNEGREWIRILKTTNQRRIKRQREGRKITSVDSRYTKMAEDSLYGELSLVLQIPRTQAESYILAGLETESV